MEDNTTRWSEVKNKIAFEQFKFRAKDKINSVKNGVMSIEKKR